MKNHIIYLLISGFFFTGWVCGDREGNLMTPRTEEVRLISSSFETNGRFSMDGWTLTESTLSELVDSSDDTPFSGSRHSLKLRRDTLTGNAPGVTKTVISSNADTSTQYYFSFYSKGKGTMLVLQRTPDGPRGETYYINSANWNSISFPLTKARPNKDTITIIFRPLNVDPIPHLYIDEIRMSYWRKN